MKKVTVLFSMIVLLGLTACGGSQSEGESADDETLTEEIGEGIEETGEDLGSETIEEAGEDIEHSGDS